jgi:hypothetical protein
MSSMCLGGRRAPLAQPFVVLMDLTFSAEQSYN